MLKAVFDVTVAGDDEPIPMVERPEIQAVIAEPDPARKIRLYSQHAVAVQPRIAPIQLLVRDAAATDGLKPGLSADHVRDLLWTFNSVELFELLVLARGWSPERYAEFVADTPRCRVDSTLSVKLAHYGGA